MSGTKPVGGTIKIENWRVVKDGSIIHYKDYTVAFSNGVAQASDTAILCTSIKPEIQNVHVDGILSNEVVVGVEATEENPYALGAAYKCNLGDGDRTFFVLREEESNIKLILNENLGDIVAWDSSGTNGDGSVTATTHLSSQTKGWTRLFGEKGTVEIPNAEDVLHAIEHDDNPSYTDVSDWMRTNFDLSKMVAAYWINLRDADDSTKAWDIGYQGSTATIPVDTIEGVGVRLVITISKANMSL